MIKTLEKLLEKIFTGANLIALGFVLLYRILYEFLLREISQLHGHYIVLRSTIELETQRQELRAATTYFLDWVTDMAWTGLFIAGVCFIIAQTIDYKKKNFSWLNFIVMLILYGGVVFVYVDQIIKLAV